MPNSYQYHNQYHGFYYNHHGNPVDIYSRYYQYNLPVSQVAPPKDFQQYQQISPHQQQHPPQEYHHQTPIPSVNAPMETVIKPATATEVQEPTLCEILTKAENNRRSLELQQKCDSMNASFSLDMANVSLVDTMKYMPVLDDVSQDGKTMAVDIPNPQVTFIYELDSGFAQDEQMTAVKMEKTPERFEDIVKEMKLEDEMEMTMKAKSPVKRVRKYKKLEYGDLLTEPRVIMSDDPTLPNKFECIICLKTFNGHSYYAQHFRTRHSGVQRFRCEKCGKRFFNAETLELHTKNHTMKAYQCTECTKLFAHKYDLSRHAKTHLTKLPHECGFCNKGFVRRDHMKQHELRCKESPDFKAISRKRKPRITMEVQTTEKEPQPKKTQTRKKLPAFQMTTRQKCMAKAKNYRKLANGK